MQASVHVGKAHLGGKGSHERKHGHYGRRLEGIGSGLHEFLDQRREALGHRLALYQGCRVLRHPQLDLAIAYHVLKDDRHLCASRTVDGASANLLHLGLAQSVVGDEGAEAFGIEVADVAQIAGRREHAVVALTFYRLASGAGNEHLYNASQRHSFVGFSVLGQFGLCAHFLGFQRLYFRLYEGLASGGRQVLGRREERWAVDVQDVRFGHQERESGHVLHAGIVLHTQLLTHPCLALLDVHSGAQRSHETKPVARWSDVCQEDAKLVCTARYALIIIGTRVGAEFLEDVIDVEDVESARLGTFFVTLVVGKPCVEADAGQSALVLVVLCLLIHLAVGGYLWVLDSLVEHFFCAVLCGCTSFLFNGKFCHVV